MKKLLFFLSVGLVNYNIYASQSGSLKIGEMRSALTTALQAPQSPTTICDSPSRLCASSNMQGALRKTVQSDQLDDTHDLLKAVVAADKFSLHLGYELGEQLIQAQRAAVASSNIESLKTIAALATELNKQLRKNSVSCLKLEEQYNKMLIDPRYSLADCAKMRRRINDVLSGNK